MEVSKRDKRSTFIAAVGLAVAVFLIGAPVVEAAVQAVRVKGAVKVKDTNGGTLNSEAIPDQGLTDVPGSAGALDVRNFAGGAGLLGIAGCNPASGLPQEVSVGGGAIVTDMLMTGTDGSVVITSAAVGGGAVPVLNVRVDANNPNVIADLATGLGVTAPLDFTASGADCQLVILGHGG
jgi:hypothetical protein